MNQKDKSEEKIAVVPVLNWTPSSSGPSQSQDSGARKSCGGRTESVLTKEQLGSHLVVRERVLGVSILLHRPFLFLSLKAPSEGRSHGHPCIFSILRRILHSERKWDAGPRDHRRAGLSQHPPGTDLSGRDYRRLKKALKWGFSRHPCSDLTLLPSSLSGVAP